jgi:hypothetical protein
VGICSANMWSSCVCACIVRPARMSSTRVRSRPYNEMQARGLSAPVQRSGISAGILRSSSPAMRAGVLEDIDDLDKHPEQQIEFN